MVLYSTGRRNIWQPGQIGSVYNRLSVHSPNFAIGQASSKAKMAAEIYGHLNVSRVRSVARPS